MSKHTKEPWEVRYYHTYGDRKHGDSGTPYIMHGTDRIATVNGKQEIADANARLIAAAPDLLAACEQQREAIDRLFAILIRAQGSDKPFFPSKCGQPWAALCQGNAAVAKATE